MAPRTYKANSIQAAISMIKKDLGPDAMILSTHRKPKNARNPYGEDIFEVTAMAGVEASKDDGPNPVHKPDWPPPEPQENWGAMRDESINIKDLLFLFNKEYQLPDYLFRFPEVMQAYARMLKCGVSQPRARYFLEQGCRQTDGKAPTAQDVSKRMMKAVYQSLTVCDPFQPQPSSGPQLAAFIGPTGVGKTTTIAKLAATLNLKQKKRVGLISIDGYRIGALEQLKTYAAIMGLPCLPAFTPEDVQSAINKMRHLDHILIDTAGQSHLDEERMQELKNLVGRHLTTHLVLSVTTKAADMAEAVEKFGRLRPQTYVFTKMDETRQRGGLIDQVMNAKLPVSYITNGQKVPDDLIPATKKNIMQLIFKK